MSLLADILNYNTGFVERREYEAFLTDQFPNKKLVIVTCMDTRLVELLPRAMNFRNGDVKIIKTAGAVVAHPFGSVMRSILIAIYQLEAAEIAVIGHRGCGMVGMNCEQILTKARQRGISEDVLDTLQHAGIDMATWLRGFETEEAGVRASVEVIRNHPLLPVEIPVHGLLIDSVTGRLDVIVDGAKP